MLLMMLMMLLYLLLVCLIRDVLQLLSVFDSRQLFTLEIDSLIWHTLLYFLLLFTELISQSLLFFLSSTWVSWCDELMTMLQSLKQRAESDWMRLCVSVLHFSHQPEYCRVAVTWLHSTSAAVMMWATVSCVEMMCAVMQLHHRCIQSEKMPCHCEGHFCLDFTHCIMCWDDVCTDAVSWWLYSIRKLAHCCQGRFCLSCTHYVICWDDMCASAIALQTCSVRKLPHHHWGRFCLGCTVLKIHGGKYADCSSCRMH